MIEVKTEKGHCSTFKVDGSMFDLCADCLVILRGVYTIIQSEAGQDAADDFADVLVKMISDPDTRVFSELGESNESKQ